MPSAAVIIPPSLGNLARHLNRTMSYENDRRTLDLARAALLQECAEAAANPVTHVPRAKKRAVWPMVSENAGCQPEQVAEANANCKKMGIAAEYLPSGDVMWHSAKAKRQHIRSIGLYDRGAYY